METALDVLSRAATMVQDNANEARLSSKELPTAKWRRDRRLRVSEYHTPVVGVTHSSNSSPAGCSPPPLLPSQQHYSSAMPFGNAAHATTTALGGSNGTPPTQMSIMMATMRPLCESTNRPTPPPQSSTNILQHMSHTHHSMESPIDMSVSSTTMKQRASPPPPYREPLPGSTYATSLARPSVITQAPPKRESRDSILISNRENDDGSTESISMCETVIDEHFRRSLGPDYVSLFGKRSPALNTTPSPHSGQLAIVNTGTSTPTPPPVVVVSGPQHLPAAPYYPIKSHPLISPKPTAVLLSPNAIAARIVSEPISPLSENTQQSGIGSSIINVLQPPPLPPPPQQQPLSLQRTNSPTQCKSNSPQQQLIRLNLNNKNIPSSPIASELQSTTHSPTPSPRHSPNILTTLNSVNPTSPATVPAIARIKTEPGISASTNTPPASPTYAPLIACISASQDVLASVDDHFAKALGETWTKLQKGNEARK